MAKKVAKKTTHSASSGQSKRKHPLLREIPVLHSLVTVLYILLGILFIAIYLTRFV